MKKHLEIEPNSPVLTVGNWTIEQIDKIYQKLELPNWAPWLSASKESLLGRLSVFPKGQLVILSGDNPVASLSMNRISWDGNSNHLPCWDDVAGDPTTYEKTYDSIGNTLVMMSMNVDPKHQGEGLARKLIEEARSLAKELDVDYLIGSFRPNEFGKYKSVNGQQDTKFEDYIRLKRLDGLPIDSWLRNLTRNGMSHLAVDNHAMTVVMSLEELNLYKNYNSNMWKQIAEQTWECGEVGSWLIDYKNNTATYQESNLWGTIWQKPGLQ